MVIRASSESFEVMTSRVTLGLMCQPGALENFFTRTGQLSRSLGFLARTLISYPESTQGFRTNEDTVYTPVALRRFNRRIKEIMALWPDLVSGAALSPICIPLSGDAKDKFLEYCNEIEPQLLTGNRYQDHRDVASKIADNAARIAGLFHFLEYGGNDSIGLGSMLQAIDVTRWYLNESLRLLDGHDISADQSASSKLEAYLIRYKREHKADNMPLRILLQKGPKSLRKKKLLLPEIEKLKQRNLVQYIGNTVFFNPSWK